MKRKEILKKLVTELSLETTKDLVCISRVVDYITEELVIRQETYENMSQEKLFLNIRLKM